MCDHNFVELPTHWFCTECGRTAKKKTWAETINKLEALYLLLNLMLIIAPDYRQDELNQHLSRLDSITEQIRDAMDKNPKMN